MEAEVSSNYAVCRSSLKPEVDLLSLVVPIPPGSESNQNHGFPIFGYAIFGFYYSYLAFLGMKRLRLALHFSWAWARGGVRKGMCPLALISCWGLLLPFQLCTMADPSPCRPWRWEGLRGGKLDDPRSEDSGDVSKFQRVPAIFLLFNSTFGDFRHFHRDFSRPIAVQRCATWAEPARPSRRRHLGHRYWGSSCLEPGIVSYPLVMTNIMENGPFIDGLPIKNGDFPWLC